MVLWAQVMGHAKTVLVLVVSWAFFNDTFTIRKLVGMLLAVIGMIVYGIAASNHQQAPPLAAKLDVEVDKGEPLLSPLLSSTTGRIPLNLVR